MSTSETTSAPTTATPPPAASATASADTAPAITTPADTAPVKPRTPRSSSPIARFLVLLIQVLAALVAARFVLILLGANVDHPIVASLLSLTDPFSTPFEGIFPQPADDAGVLPIDLGAIIGIGVLEAVALVAAFALVLLVADAISAPLFTALAASTLGLVLLYAITRPSLARRGLAWAAVRRRAVALVGVGGIVLLGGVAYAGDEVRHPAVDAATLATDWTMANGTLAGVMGGYVRWFDASGADRPAILRDMRGSTRRFADDVDLLERVRPPEAALRTHLAVVALYVRIAELLDGLPDALAKDDTTTAASIVRSVSTLADTASDYVRLAAPPQ